MTDQQFILAMIGTLAWPTVAIIAIVAFAAKIPDPPEPLDEVEEMHRSVSPAPVSRLATVRTQHRIKTPPTRPS